MLLIWIPVISLEMEQPVANVVTPKERRDAKAIAIFLPFLCFAVFMILSENGQNSPAYDKLYSASATDLPHTRVALCAMRLCGRKFKKLKTKRDTNFRKKRRDVYRFSIYLDQEESKKMMVTFVPFPRTLSKVIFPCPMIARRRSMLRSPKCLLSSSFNISGSKPTPSSVISQA